MYDKKTRLILMACAAGAAMLWIDIAYGAGRVEGKLRQSALDIDWETSETSEPDPSPGEVEPDDSPSPTESDEA